MRAGERGDEVYETWWLPMQKLLSPSDLEALFWIDLIWRSPDSKAGDIYSGQVERLRHLDQEQVLDEVKRFKRLAELFAIYRDPSLERDERVARQLRRVKSWGIGSMDVLVLFWLRLRDDGVIDDADVADALHVIESFLVRRIIIGAPANSLPKIFNRAVTELGETPSVDGLRRYFTVGRKFFATDAQVTEAVLTKPFYYQGRPNQRKTVLAWLEEATPITFLGKERVGKEFADVSATSIEHVMPQTLSPTWRDSIASQTDDRSVDEVHEELLHTLANLTLTAYNSELSNRPFVEKRELLESSGLRLNREIAARQTWGPDAILERGRVLAERIVTMKRPGIRGGPDSPRG
ncbi:HNH endonuclease family protein [Agromyces luteolus]|nr:HNH endonuclease family protein [Agromyces luteolus]